MKKVSTKLFLPLLLTFVWQLGTAQLACNALVNVSTDPWQCSAVITPEMILEGGPYDYSVMEVSPELLSADDLGEEVDVTVTETTTGNTCWGKVVLEDKTPPVAVSVQNLVAMLTDDCTVRIYAEDVDNGSYDGCTSVSFDPEYIDYTAEDLGVNQFTLEVSDASGNTNMVWSDVRIEQGNCIPGLVVTYPMVNLSIAEVDTIFLTPQMFVEKPKSLVSGYAITPQYVTSANLGITEILIQAPDDAIYTSNLMLCADSFSIVETLKIIETITPTGTATVTEDQASVEIDNSCTSDGFILSFSNTSNSEGSFVVTCDDLGLSDYTIYLWSGNVLLAEATNILQVLDGMGICNNLSDCDESSINWPLATMFVSADVGTQNVSDLVSPDNLVDQFNYTADQAQVLLDPQCGFSWSYSDDVFDEGNGSYKIFRGHTVVDWSTSNRYDYNQIIKVSPIITNTSLACNDQVNVSVNPWGCSASLHPDMFLEGGPYNYDVMILILKDENGNTLNLDINAVPMGTYTYEVMDTVADNTCWGNLFVEDKTPPIAIAVQNIVVSLTFDPADPNSGTAKLFVDQVDNGSHDGTCGPVKLEPEFWIFDCGDIGPNEITMKVWDDADGDGMPGSTADDNYNEVWTIVEVEAKIDIEITCPEHVVVSCAADIGDETVIDNITGRPQVEESACSSAVTYNDQVGVDLNGDGDLDDEIIIDEPTIDITVVEEYDECQNYAVLRTWSIGNSSCEQYIYVEKDNSFDPASIVWPADLTVDCEESISQEPSWDQSCGFVGYSVNQDTFLFENDACRKIISQWTVVDWCSYDPNIPDSGVYTNTSIIRVQDVVGPIMEAAPDITVNCSPSEIALAGRAIDQCDLDFLSWEISIDYDNDWSIDQVEEVETVSGDEAAINLDESRDGIHRIVWQVRDGCGNTTTATSYVTINDDGTTDQVAPVPYCINLSTAVMSGGMVEVWAVDFNQGSFDNCTSASDLRYTFTDTAPENDSNFNTGSNSSSRLITAADLDVDGFIQLAMYVWDLAGNADFCLVNLRVVDGGDCNQADIVWPVELIEVNTVVGNQSPSAVASPDNLIASFGYAEEDVYPILPDNCEMIYAYEDQIIESSNDFYKIVRTWTVLNWLTEETYERSQIIKINNEPSYICDFLPNTAPVTDCETGHTLEDDVEWPADISVSDHRISPDDLEQFSSIPSKDSRPVFYNSPDLYTAIYEDFVEDLTASELVIKRRWSVNRQWVTGYVWNYEQLLTIDLEGLTGLVSVNTMNNRPIPGVQLTSSIMTDGSGIGVVGENDSVEPFLMEDALNGLNVRDLHLIRNHILGISVLNDHQKRAADYDNSNSVSTLDLVKIQRIILGVEVEDVEWRFLEIPPINGLPTKGQYIGIKPGDVDDSAILTSDPFTYDETSLTYKDILITRGQSYSLNLDYEAERSVWGIEVRMDYDVDDVVISSVSSEAFDNVQFNAVDGKLTIIGLGSNGALTQLDGVTALTVNFDAVGNTVLSEALDFSSDRNSFILNQNEELLILNGEVEDKLSTGTQDTEYGQISVYPNPVVENLYINVDSQSTSDYEVRLIDVAGRTVIQGKNVQEMNVSQLEQGYYLLQVILGDKSYEDRVIIAR